MAYEALRKILASSVVGLALLPWACHRKPVATTASLPVPPTPAPTPLPSPVPDSLPAALPEPPLPKRPNSFEQGEIYFRNGDYARAAKAYEQYLGSNPRTNQDQALFRLALAYAIPESPIRDMPKALGLLQQVVNRFPQSPYKQQAEFVIGLQGEVDKLRTDVGKRDDRIRELTNELEQLKKIDMQRRPSRPSP